MMKYYPVCEPLLNGNELKYVQDAIETGWISSAGKYVSLFEEKFAEYCGVKYAVGVCNGTVALHLALTALGVTKGDEVIIPNFTMIASAFAVCYTGAVPVFVDADKDTWNIDVTKIEEKITRNTKAIMPVSIFGLPCDMKKIHELADKYNLKIIEDAAESHGAEYNGKKTGNLADITCFSFFANKNLTTGEGGMVVTNDSDLYDKIRYYKNLCFPLDAPRNYLHNDVGFNYRISNLHSAIGLAQVEKGNYYRELRIRNAEYYNKYLGQCKWITFQKDYSLHEVKETQKLNVHWMNGILVDTEKLGRSREELTNHLKENGIDTRVFFTGMNKQPALQKFGCNCTGYYEITDNLSKNGFYLPSGSNLEECDIKKITDRIIAFGEKK